MDDGQVLVKFVTKLPEEFRVPATGITVPPDIKRYGLSQVINHLLELEPQRPFDFLVNGELLRATLKQYLTDNNLSAETTLEIEYVPAVVPPKQKDATPHDDWVSCVDGSRRSRIISGSYDGLVRLYDGALKPLVSFQGHAGGVSAVRFLPESQDSAAGALLATAGKDHLVKLWAGVDVATAENQEAPAPRCVAVFEGHVDAVEALAPNPAGTHLASAGWDGRLLLWAAGKELVAQQAEAVAGKKAAPEPAAKKKRKTTVAEADADAPLEVTECLRGLEGHLNCVASVAWPVNSTLYSGGWDHSVRKWDVELGASANTYNGSKAVCCVAAAALQPAVVAFGGADKALRLWDTRSRGEGLNVRGLGAHDGWVSSLSWRADSEFHVISGSYDCSIKLWDIRCGIPLGTEKKHSEKVLCVSWHGSEAMVSGGADCQLVLYDAA